MGSFPWIALQVMSPFSKMFKGLIEMRLLWMQEINLDETRLGNPLGKAIPRTPLAQALIESGFVQHESGTGQVVRP